MPRTVSCADENVRSFLRISAVHRRGRRGRWPLCAEGWRGLAGGDGRRGRRRSPQARVVAGRGRVDHRESRGQASRVQVKLRGPAKAAPDEIRTSGKAPLFVVADTHGEYEILAAMLQKHGVVDAQLGWKFGRGDLVVLGDVFDRGPNHTEILWLLYQLEAEARQRRRRRAPGARQSRNHGAAGRPAIPESQVRADGAIAGRALLFGVVWRDQRARPVAAHAAHGAQDQRPAVPARRHFARARRQRHVAAGNQRGRACAARWVDARRRCATRRAALLMGSMGPLWYRGYFAEQTDVPDGHDGGRRPRAGKRSARSGFSSATPSCPR